MNCHSILPDYQSCNILQKVSEYKYRYINFKKITGYILKYKKQEPILMIGTLKMKSELKPIKPLPNVLNPDIYKEMYLVTASFDTLNS